MDRCHKCCDNLDIKDNCCVNAKIDVEKNIISVIKVPLDTQTGTSSLIINYEIIINNKSPRKIINLKVSDSLWGIGLTGSDEVVLTVTAESCCSTIVTNSGDTIISSCGELVDSTESYVDGCSVCTILLTLALRPIERRLGTPDLYINIPYVLNTVTISGKLEPIKPYNACKIGSSFIPIFAKTVSYGDDFTYTNTGPHGLGGACNSKLCIPYTNTRCKTITCPRPRPK